VYTAPEVIAAARSSPSGGAAPLCALYGPPADCWAYGLTAFKLLTGVSLFGYVDAAAAERAAERDGGMDDDGLAWDVRRMADLHAEWVRLLLLLRTTTTSTSTTTN
jgi:hypothetical protein